MSEAHQNTSEPIFDVPQADGTSVSIDLSRPGTMGDLWIDVDGVGRTGFLLAYHSYEADILTTIYRQWASRSRRPESIVDEIDAVRAWLASATTRRTPTDKSEHDFRQNHGWLQANADDFVEPLRLECWDQARWPMIVDPKGSGLQFKRPVSDDVAGGVEVFVPNEYLRLLVAGLIWRTYGEGDHSFSSLTRHNTVAYLSALDDFERSIRQRL